MSSFSLDSKFFQLVNYINDLLEGIEDKKNMIFLPNRMTDIDINTNKEQFNQFLDGISTTKKTNCANIQLENKK